jgi:hypothetical protein
VDIHTHTHTHTQGSQDKTGSRRKGRRGKKRHNGSTACSSFPSFFHHHSFTIRRRNTYIHTHTHTNTPHLGRVYGFTCIECLLDV